GRGLKRYRQARQRLRDGVAPALRGGRGLKPIIQHTTGSGRVVAPALRGGRGLKREAGNNWRERLGCGSRPSGRERIETEAAALAGDARRVAPALRGGRGLKPGMIATGDPLFLAWLPPFGAGE